MRRDNRVERFLASEMGAQHDRIVPDNRTNYDLASVTSIYEKSSSGIINIHPKKWD